MVKKLIPVAICYDFDGTLSPGNIQDYDFMKSIGVRSSSNFWNKSDEMAKEHHADQIAAYMYMMLQEANKKGVPFSRKTLRKYGQNVQLFAGVKEWFKNINDYGRKQGVAVHHYILSSGLKEMLLGTPIAKQFHAIFASDFMYDENDIPFWPAIVLNYTSKTQYLFRINKGCENVCDNDGINHYIKPSQRAVPFTQMIYVGDGETDVPCMRIVRQNGGHSIAVYNPEKKGGKAKIEQLIKDQRVNFVAPADYRRGRAIDTYVRCVIDKIATDVALKKLLPK